MIQPVIRKPMPESSETCHHLIYKQKNGELALFLEKKKVGEVNHLRTGARNLEAGGNSKM